MATVTVASGEGAGLKTEHMETGSTGEAAGLKADAGEEEVDAGAGAALRPKRENAGDGDRAAGGDAKRSRSGKRHKDTDQSLAALNLLQPFNVPQYRFTPVVPYEAVALSPFDRAPQLRLSKDGLTVAGHKGYRLIRGTHGISQGAWYCEATVMEDLQDPDLEERCAGCAARCARRDATQPRGQRSATDLRRGPWLAGSLMKRATAGWAGRGALPTFRCAPARQRARQCAGAPQRAEMRKQMTLRVLTNVLCAAARGRR
jgi:hypothetical protein